MSEPQVGDVTIRVTAVGFEVVDAITGRLLAPSLSGWAAAVARAEALTARHVWQQRLDNRGRPLGVPSLLSDPKTRVR